MQFCVKHIYSFNIVNAFLLLINKLVKQLVVLFAYFKIFVYMTRYMHVALVLKNTVTI